MNRQPRTFAQTLWTCFAHTFVIVGVLFAAMAISRMAPVEDRVGEFDRPAPAGSPRALLEAHGDDCWTAGQAPKAELPGAAIVRWTRTGKPQAAEYVTKRGVVSSAFDEVLASAGFGDHEDERFIVVALCV